MTVRRSVRTVHRWLSPVFTVGLLVSLIFTGVGGSQSSPIFTGLGVVIVTSIVTLLVTGTIMFFQHSWPRWSGGSRSRQTLR
jgi:hypothetical protein